MIYSALLKHVSDAVEGEVLLTINGIDVTCFAYASLPADAKEGVLYSVELTTQVFNDYSVQEQDEDKSASLTQIDDGFSYVITGTLNGNSIDVGGIVFEDDVLLSEFGYLEGRVISWRVDRIDAEFV